MVLQITLIYEKRNKNLIAKEDTLLESTDLININNTLNYRQRWQLFSLYEANMMDGLKDDHNIGKQ